MNPTDHPELSNPKLSGSHRGKTSKIQMSISKKNRKRVFYCFTLKVQGFVRIPGYEPVELDLEKLFLLSVSKENLDFRREN